MTRAATIFICHNFFLALAGVENLEERMVEAGKVDPMVLEYLERKFGS